NRSEGSRSGGTADGASREQTEEGEDDGQTAQHRRKDPCPVSALPVLPGHPKPAQNNQNADDNADRVAAIHGCVNGGWFGVRLLIEYLLSRLIAHTAGGDQADDQPDSREGRAEPHEANRIAD